MKKSAKAKKLTLRRFDAAEFLTDAETIAGYLERGFRRLGHIGPGDMSGAAP